MRTDLLAADVEELIREAQGEARAAVKARLRARFEEALLEAAEARLAGVGAEGPEPDARLATADAPAEQGDALWLYCVTARGEAPHVDGVAAGQPPQVVEAAGLAALEGRGEWGVKVTADRERVAERLRQRNDQRPAGVGGSYLGRKQQDLRLRDEVDAALDAAVQESHARLEEWAVASELLPPQRAELSGHSGEMVLNGAYLVDDERLDGFRTVVEELGRQYGGEDKGLAFELTGPWPPYNFVGNAQ